jgi:hypothetical protein
MAKDGRVSQRVGSLCYIVVHEGGMGALFTGGRACIMNAVL